MLKEWQEGSRKSVGAVSVLVKLEAREGHSGKKDSVSLFKD